MKKAALAMALAAVLGCPPLSARIPSAEAVPLKDFASLMAALESGGSVRAVFRYREMTLTVAGKPEPVSPDAVGGMALSAWEAFAAGVVGNPERYVTSSESRLIRHPRYGVVLNYVKASVYESGAVKILAQYLDPRTFKVRMDETFTARIGGEGGGGGAYFFRLD